jgi:SAM-dependent methyltransferase
MSETHTQFTGSVPRLYDAHLGPFLFEPYAAHFVARSTYPAGCRVLELACGTGILTRRILKALPADGKLTATDLNGAMVEHARERMGADRRLQWQMADATALPFPDASFDRVACQFGVMFFPDKHRAYREVHRVLAPGGEFAFNVWDSVERNPYVGVAEGRVASFFPGNPPTFFQVPFGYHDREEIRAGMKAAGFSGIRMEEVALDGESPSAHHAAVGLVEGCPLIAAIHERGVSDAAPIVQAVAQDLAAQFGDSPMRCRLSALWIAGTKA